MPDVNQEEYYASKQKILISDHPAFTIEQWNALGEDFFRGLNGKVKDYVHARICYEEILKKEPKHRNALYSLGILYEGGLGVDKDVVKARSYYDKAVLQGGFNSKKRLLRLDHPTFTADQWNALGVDYYNNNEKDYVSARLCFAEALKKNSKYTYANFNLGVLYECGLGLIVDVTKARSYYDNAAQEGYELSIKRLLQLDHPKFTTEQWNTLGENFFWGRNGIVRDYVKARICYEEILKNDPKHQNALYSLGVMYEIGHGVAEDFTKADQYYETLKSLNIIKYKKDFKRFERKRAEKALLNGQSLDAVLDANNRTPLHRAAIFGSPKTYARLKHLNADDTKKDNMDKTPGDYLTNIAKVTNTQDKLTIFIDKYHKAAPQLIVQATSPLNADEEKELLNTLTNFYKIDEIKPLFDLAKLAILGRHRLSKRPGVITDGYDSDDELDPTLDESFKIIIDPQNKTLCRIFPEGSTAGLGVYWRADETRNVIHLSGLYPTLSVASTLVHELCHFIAHEIYDNHCLPYRSDDLVRKANFTAISDELENKKSKLNHILERAFLPNYKAKQQEHAELIVRVAQIIVTYPKGLELLQDQAPRLLHYYINDFLPDIKNHIKKLEAKAFGHWSPQLFARSSVPSVVAASAANIPTNSNVRNVNVS